MTFDQDNYRDKVFSCLIFTLDSTGDKVYAIVIDSVNETHLLWIMLICTIINSHKLKLLIIDIHVFKINLQTTIL